jgi:hypothetical protein
MIEEDIIRELKILRGKITELETKGQPRWVYLTTPLTSTDWDGDAHSNTSPTEIDLSAVFGVPAGVKAILVQMFARDSGSAGEYIFALDSRVSVSWSGMLYCNGGDVVRVSHAVVTCDPDGDVNYYIVASGTNTMDCWIRIWGYLI